MTIQRDTYTSSALLVLYRAADEASETGRAFVFRAIARLTGRTIEHVTATWKDTQ